MYMSKYQMIHYYVPFGPTSPRNPGNPGKPVGPKD